ncbi:uncharacterized protein LOC128682430 [Plodia interpunctella]|uniref:uncharacterized protein LOC128682430 n=1 Tax=Plodia interpunctella TaxID=58824 RepID=UPI00236893B3|nr:uncharacterized protein LOC128682430 [Plodia interpunctella]
MSNQQVNVESLEMAGNASSRSSLRSIASLEWDGRCKSEYVFRTRSLPRQKANSTQNLYRTRSHSGFVNSYIKNPDPTHYHLPRCRSCGTINNSYVWELTRESLGKIRMPNSMYFSVDNIQQKCIDEGLFEPNLIKVKEKVLPVYKIVKQEAEFVESQEFNEDNYLGDLGNSFSSENQTVIEQANAKNVCVSPKSEIVQVQESEIRHREVPVVNTDDINNNTIESTEGEYHSFTDEMDFEDATYNSPVKELVEKDIRDYSVPIKYYCDDYKKSCSPQKSPQKFCENTSKATILEPILEESKTSDDLNVDNKSKESSFEPDVTGNEISKEIDEDDKADINEENNDMISSVTSDEKEKCNLEKEIHEYEQTVTKNFEFINKQYNSLIESKSTDSMDTDSLIVKASLVAKPLEISDIVRISVVSNTSSAVEATSFNSTVEFEIYELISDIVSSLLNKIDFENDSVHFFHNFAQGHFKTNCEVDNKNNNSIDPKLNDVYDIKSDLVLTQKYLEDKFIAKSVTTDEIECNEEILSYDAGFADKGEVSENSKLGVTIVVPIINYELSISSEEKITEDSNKNENISEALNISNQDFFSIKQIIEELETNVNLNETVLTEVSESENQTNKIIQPILYHVFDRAYGMCSDRFKKSTAKKTKRVVTVVDSEDILATAQSLWSNLEVKSEIKSIVELNCDLKDLNNAHEQTNFEENFMITETCFDDNTPDNCETYELKHKAENTFDESTKICDPLSHDTVDMKNESQFEEPGVEDIVNICEEMSFNENYAYETQISNDNVDLNDSSHNKTIYDFSETTYDIAENFEENTEQKTEDEIILNETFILDDKDEHMNTAFVDSVDSNQNSKIVFDCNESPIKKSVANFVGEELSVLYEKDDTLMGSPFVKKAAVITMEQIESTGGVKYWLSFDENVEQDVKPVARTAKRMDDTLPSFVCFDFDESKLDTEAKEAYFEEKRRSGVLDNISFGMNTSSVSLEYKTCESEIFDSKNELDEPQKKLLYDNRLDKSKTRLYSSWPPFEDTLFYRIISQFRMSESFDPNDFNGLTMNDYPFKEDLKACGDGDNL